MAKIILSDIEKSWGSVTAVSKINLEINDGEFIVILGPSGCGKTTTMRMVAGLEDPTSGKIMIDDLVVNDLEPKDRDVAMVFQNYGLYPHLNVFDNIRFPLKVRKVDPEKQNTRVKKAAKLVELEHLLDRKPKELSGGQRQRVALARAIVREPKVFLMDEPLSNLDAKLRVSTRSQLQNLHHELKVTTIYVTHDQVEAMTLADRVVVMNHGNIQQIGTPSTIYNYPANIFVAGFIGSPPMNIIRGKITDGVFSNDMMNVKVENQINGETYIGFRAEDAEIVTEQDQANMKANIYSLELLGEAMIVNILIQKEIVAIKANKYFQGKIGDVVMIKIPIENCHFFDIQSRQRIDTK